MAWIFSLSVECGEDLAAADVCATHFTFSSVCSNGAEYPFTCRVSKIGGNGWWCIASTEGVSKRGITSAADQEQMDKLAEILYRRLRTAPPYRFALVGVEAEGFRSFEELDDDVEKLDFSGLVLSEEVWRGLGASAVFVAFEAGYVWRPFTKVK